MLCWPNSRERSGRQRQGQQDEEHRLGTGGPGSEPGSGPHQPSRLSQAAAHADAPASHEENSPPPTHRLVLQVRLQREQRRPGYSLHFHPAGHQDHTHVPTCTRTCARTWDTAPGAIPGSWLPRLRNLTLGQRTTS